MVSSFFVVFPPAVSLLSSYHFDLSRVCEILILGALSAYFPRISGCLTAVANRNQMKIPFFREELGIFVSVNTLFVLSVM